MEKEVYIENGYNDRRHYFECLSDEYDVPIDVIDNISEVLGADEDFDGLVGALEDYPYHNNH